MQIGEIHLDEIAFIHRISSDVIAEASQHMGSAENPM
jgi:hypothetical protein